MSPYKKALLIYNNKAGQTEIEKSLAAVLPVLSAHIKELKVIQTEVAGETTELCREHGEEVELVIILGGDGTVNEAINGLARLQKRPALAILPGGTCNDFTRVLNIPQNLAEAAELIINGHTRPVDVGKVNNRYFLNFWGIGLVADTSDNINENEKKFMGKLSYFLSAIRTLKEAETFKFTMEVDGEIIEDEAVMILVMNGKYIGTTQIPFPVIKIDDGLLDVIVVKESTLAIFYDLLNVDKIIDEDQTDPDARLLHYQAKSVSVKTNLVKQADTDGEIDTETPASMGILKHHIHMIAGK